MSGGVEPMSEQRSIDVVWRAVQMLAVMFGASAAVLATAASQVWGYPIVAGVLGNSAALFGVSALFCVSIWAMCPVLVPMGRSEQKGKRFVVFVIVSLLALPAIASFSFAVGAIMPMTRCFGPAAPRACSIDRAGLNTLSPDDRRKLWAELVP